MPRAGLDAEAVVAVAASLADEYGLEELTLARLADRLGVRSPSLYVHVDGLSDLRSRLATRGARELTAALRSAVADRVRAEALPAVADAYRAYAHEHPGAYAAIQRAPGADPDPDPGFVAAAADLVDVLVALLRDYGRDDDDAIHAVRIVRAALHGFVSLERAGGFAIELDLDETYARLVQMLDQGLASQT